jgi:magnesium-transporting ATPase (P-type)
MPEERTRLLAFTAIIVANLSLILFARAGGRRMLRHVAAANRALWAIVLGTMAMYSLIVLVSPLRQFFRMAMPLAADGLILGVATLMLWFALGVLNAVYEMLGTYEVTR